MRRCLSQEGLKLLACLTMVVDHIGAVFFPGAVLLRVIGRLSFPIFCFLIAEGVYHTRHPGKYALRLLGMVLISEIPFDYCFFGRIYWYHQNVMVTLLLGFAAVCAVNHVSRRGVKLLCILAVVLISLVAKADYGVEGVLLILLFALTRELPYRPLVQLAGMFLIFFDPAGWPLFTLLGLPVTMRLTCVLAMVPIALYSGEKQSYSKWLQWGFYLFYPLHLAVLCLMK